MDWPPQSPDLNITEAEWDHLKRERNKRQPKFKEQLWEVLKAAWYIISEDDFRKRQDGLPKRIQDVLSAKGGPTKYWHLPGKAILFWKLCFLFCVYYIYIISPKWSVCVLIRGWKNTWMVIKTKTFAQYCILKVFGNIAEECNYFKVINRHNSGEYTDNI